MTQEEAVRKVVEEFVTELLAILNTVKQEKVEPVKADPVDLKPFFDHIRKPLFGRLSASQVSGHEDIIKELKERNVPLPQAAYVLATAYHETAKTMQPVKEGLKLSDAWRKKNLRYYPWYGRGHVQLTWEENYRKADQKLGLGGALVANPDLALDPKVSAEVLVTGSVEGWFSGDKKGRHTLDRHIKKGTLAEFKQARRIINIMDKADLIAGYAVIYQDALKKVGY